MSHIPRHNLRSSLTILIKMPLCSRSLGGRLPPIIFHRLLYIRLDVSHGQIDATQLFRVLILGWRNGQGLGLFTRNLLALIGAGVRGFIVLLGVLARKDGCGKSLSLERLLVLRLNVLSGWCLLVLRSEIHPIVRIFSNSWLNIFNGSTLSSITRRHSIDLWIRSSLAMVALPRVLISSKSKRLIMVVRNLAIMRFDVLIQQLTRRSASGSSRWIDLVVL